MRFDDNAACAVLFGQHHLNLARIEQKLPVSIVTRGNEVFIQGESEGEVRHSRARGAVRAAQARQCCRPRRGRRHLAHGDGRARARQGAG